MTFPQYRRHTNGNTLYKVLSATKMAIVHNMANVVYKLEVTNNHLTIADALQDEFAQPSDECEWNKRYNQALRNVIEAGM